MFHVYLIRNLINDKIYIGKTDNVHKRWLKHLAVIRAGTGMFLIHHAIKKYGENNFEVKTIDSDLSEKDILNKEIFWIDFYKSNICKYPDELGYNLTDGGEGISGHKHSNETKKKMSEMSKGKPKSDYHKMVLSKAHTGKTLSEVHKKAIGFSSLGKNHSDESKEKLSISKLGTKNPNSILNEANILEVAKLFSTKTNSEIR